MIIVNESMRPFIEEPAYQIKGITAMNSNLRIKDKCTWAAHSDTSYCKKFHVQLLKPFETYTDPIYFGTIGLLQSTGNYAAANIFFLVILFPLFIWFSLVKIIDYLLEIKKIKAKNND